MGSCHPWVLLSGPSPLRSAAGRPLRNVMTWKAAGFELPADLVEVSAAVDVDGAVAVTDNVPLEMATRTDAAEVDDRIADAEVDVRVTDAEGYARVCC